MLIPRRSILLCALLLIASGCEKRAQDAAVQPAPSPAAPATPSTPPAPAASLRCAEPVADFGDVVAGEIKHHRFELENAGASAIAIRRVETTCGCTLAKVETSDGTVLLPEKGFEPPGGLLTLAPGAHCAIAVDFDSKGLAASTVEKHLHVVSSDPSNPEQFLTLRAHILTPVKVDPASVNFGELRRGEARTRTVRLDPIHLKDAVVLGIDDAPPWLAARAIAKPGADGSPGFDLEMTLQKDAPCGYLQPRVTVRFGPEPVRAVPVPVYATIKSAIVFDTGNAENKERLDFGTLKPGQVKTLAIDVRNELPAVPYRIRSAGVDSDKLKGAIATRFEEVEPGIRWRVEVTFTADASLKFFRGVLKIESDHPDQPLAELPLQGWVESG